MAHRVEGASCRCEEGDGGGANARLAAPLQTWTGFTHPTTLLPQLKSYASPGPALVPPPRVYKIMRKDVMAALPTLSLSLVDIQASP